MPKLSISDFEDASFNPLQDDWSSKLPSSDYLLNTTLDPSLGFGGVPSLEDMAQYMSIMDIFKIRNSLGSIHQQQFLLYDVSSSLGVPSGTVSAVLQGLQAFEITVDAVQNEQTLSDYVVISTAIGAVGQLMSAIPTIYTQIAGAIINFGVGIGGLIVKQKNKNKPELPPEARPLQQFDSNTDEYQFNAKIRTITQTAGGYADYTPLFGPRFSGQLTGQHRMTGGMRAFAWGLGNGKVNKSGNDAEFNPISTQIGFIPGGRRITSLIQVSFIGTPLTSTDKVGGVHSDTIYDPRCGEGMTASLDVGEYYPGSSNGCLTIWDWANKLSQVMYSINADKLDGQWKAYIESMWEGIEYYWDRDSYQNWWGCSAWEGAVGDLSRAMCVGYNDVIGGFGAWSPSIINKGPITVQDRSVWETQNIYGRIIKRALFELRERQLYYLKNTVIAAYLPSEGGVAGATLLAGASTDAQVNAEFIAARKRILEGNQEKYWVRLDDVQDLQYRQLIDDAGGGWIPQHQGAIKADLPPQQPTPGIAIPPWAPPPPLPPNPGGGAPFGNIAQPFKPRDPVAPPKSWLEQYGPYIAGGAAVAATAYLGYRFSRRKANGLYLPTSVG